MQNPEISIVIPLYNEEAVFHELKSRLQNIKNQVDIALEFVLVDDGSKDQTPLLMRQLAMEDASFQCVFLSRNHGHQLAITAGMACARGSKAVMLMDGDLQDPPELVADFYNKINEGYDVVYAVRKKRKESAFKRFSYWLFYRLQRMMTDFDIPLDSGDFSMMSRRVVDIINVMPERSRFIRGIRSWVGFKQIGIEYERDGRAAGETKYALKNLLKLAYDGIFNFSDVPLKLITRLGMYTILLSLIYVTWIICKKLFWGNVPEGFTTLIVVISLFSGVQLISLGVIGEYLSRIYNQVRERPVFIIKERIVSQRLVQEGLEQKTSK